MFKIKEFILQLGECLTICIFNFIIMHVLIYATYNIFFKFGFNYLNEYSLFSFDINIKILLSSIFIFIYINLIQTD